jgi:hypothetical protein
VKLFDPPALNEPPKRPRKKPQVLIDVENKTFWDRECELNPSHPKCRAYEE